ncbi:hypothetical protein C0Q70_10013 [Pomacea canaliculata]|uniref:Uncharacterized protein n=1 Tax=Pomacea canaliculata TaxID=400727 RepID=A0A2T7PBF5_POMCA|nr:hypothetical protein C0Q70_10013 [Pomacea canaliculata]
MLTIRLATYAVNLAGIEVLKTIALRSDQVWMEEEDYRCDSEVEADSDHEDHEETLEHHGGWLGNNLVHFHMMPASAHQRRGVCCWCTAAFCVVGQTSDSHRGVGGKLVMGRDRW